MATFCFWGKRLRSELSIWQAKRLPYYLVMSGIAEHLEQLVERICAIDSVVLVPSLVICLLASNARGSMWSDPEWDQMIRESDVIALAEVVEGGRFVAKVKPLTVFKGNLTNEIYLGGYNNGGWPDDAIEHEAYKAKQQYYLFLRSTENNRIAIDILEGEANDSRDELLKAAAAAAKSGGYWTIWTPSAGDLPVEGEQVRYSLLRTSYPNAAPKQDKRKFERILRAAISNQLKHKPDAALLKETLQQIREQQRRAAGPGPKESELANYLACYFLVGGRDYDEVFAGIASGKDVSARFMVARLLGVINDNRSEKLLLTMLSDQDTLVQGEAVRQLGRRAPDTTGAVLLAHLENAGDGAAGPTNIMDPVRNRLDGGKLEIVRTLGQLKYRPATSALLSLVESFSDFYSMRVVLEALEKIGSQDYSPQLAKALTHESLIVEIAWWVRDHHVVGMKKPFEDLLDHLPDDNIRRPIVLGAVSEALGLIGDQATAAKLTQQLEKLSSKQVAETHEQDAAKDIIGALAALRYHLGREAVERSFFHWIGVDTSFASKPELLKTKEQLQTSIEEKARKCLSDLRRVDTEALVFIENRRELAAGANGDPKYYFVLEAGIRSDDLPEFKAEAFHARLTAEFGKQAAAIGVTRWLTETYGESGGVKDARIGAGLPTLFMWRWAQYVQATRDPQDMRFAKFLLESRLAEQWEATSFIKGVFGSAPIE